MIVKKLIFAPVFLGFLAYTLYLLAPLLTSYEKIFSFSVNDLLQLLIFSGVLILASLSFALLSAIAQDAKVVLVISLLGSLLSYFFLPAPLSYVLTVGTLIALISVYFALESKLKSYLTFQPTILIAPSVSLLSTLLILVISFCYYLSVNENISKNGFSIPDSLIDQAIKLSSQSSEQNVKGVKYVAQVPTQEQIELLKQHPELLKQYNIDPKVLEEFSNPNTSKQNSSSKPALTQDNQNSSSFTNDLAKKLIKDQFQNMIKPYMGIIPGILAVLFFVSIKSFVSLLSILLNPLIFIIFYILEKSGFISFTKEMREVKKMVV